LPPVPPPARSGPPSRLARRQLSAPHLARLSTPSVASGLVRCNTLGEGVTEKPLSVRDLRFQVAVRASADGRFTFQIFTLSGEPRTFHAGSQTYATPADAVQAGYEAIAAKRL
jgi:hypothetical protein